jgi:shikimate kinase
VIALGDGALLSEDNRTQVLDGADLVWLTAPLSELAVRVRAQLEKRPGSVPAFMQKGSVVTALGLQPLYEERVEGYAAAAESVDIKGKTPTQVAQQLISLRGLRI